MRFVSPSRYSLALACLTVALAALAAAASDVSVLDRPDLTLLR
jgi:hypothetical protein